MRLVIYVLIFLASTVFTGTLFWLFGTSGYWKAIVGGGVISAMALIPVAGTSEAVIWWLKRQ